MSKFKNSRKESFLDSIPQLSLDDKKFDIVLRSKFNFSFFDNSQDAGQDFHDWDKDQICKLINKLKEYSRFSLEHWKKIKIGSGKYKNSVLVEYDSFPKNSDFIFPKHVPHQAVWSRFRLEQSVRLVGFTIPKSYHNKKNEELDFFYDSNTFYIVFLDRDHRFYLAK